MASVLIAAASLAAPPPAAATGVGTLNIQWCGDWTACVTGTAVNTTTWHLHVGGTACTSTSCFPYTALDVDLPPLTLGYLYGAGIPRNSFDACATLTGPSFGTLHDCL